MGTLTYIELVLIMFLLLPFREPYFIRDWSIRLQKGFLCPTSIMFSLMVILLINVFLEILYERTYYSSLLAQVGDKNLSFEFYMSKITACYACFLNAVYLLVLAERITNFLVLIARLLEFELMCRYAILTQESGPTGLSYSTLSTFTVYKISTRFRSTTFS